MYVILHGAVPVKLAPLMVVDLEKLCMSHPSAKHFFVICSSLRMGTIQVEFT